ncbi:MAG: hemerythrin domain-containing protein [Planctomycetota bacterium]|jgi:hypothetical protein
MKLLIVPHSFPKPAPASVRRVERIAEEIRAAHAELARDEAFRALRPRKLGDGPALHLDDLSGIPLLDKIYDPSFLETRARLRAVDGDFVASCSLAIPGYEDYCEKRLGLGSVTWLRPRPRGNALHVASSCWSDRRVREEIISALRDDRLRYLHPHIGSHDVWAVAMLFSDASKKRFPVIAPPPMLCQFVNDKLWFTDVVKRLFGSEFVPRTHHAENYATAAHLVRWLSAGDESIALKIPDSAGGRGNLVLSPERFRDLPIGKIRTELRGLLGELDWEIGDRLLVGTWESGVLEAPSSQLWIPPEELGPPVVEGLFLQAIGSDLKSFRGSRPAHLPEQVANELLEKSWLLARLFQRLDYVGRCSFDMLLVGKDLDHCRPEFIECNGRWGGTSTPMTLMNRLFGDWAAQPYAAQAVKVPGLEKLRFAEILGHFGDDVYDAGTGCGSVVFYGPGRMSANGGIDALSLADDWDWAVERIQSEIRERIEDCVRGHEAHADLRMAFLEDHQVLTRGLAEIRALAKAGDLEKARGLAAKLDAQAGAHIEFEEGYFYPALRKILGDEFVDRLYKEHAAGKRALELLQTGEVGRVKRVALERDLEIVEDHVLSCGTLLSHLQGLPDEKQKELLAALRACRSRKQAWTELKPPGG